MATTTPAGIYYRVAGEANSTFEAQQLAMANSVNQAVGLVAIVPTSVQVSSGTASTAADGTVTYSGVSTLSINGALPAAYKSYQIVFDTVAGATGDIWFRWRSGGTDLTTNYYGATGYVGFSAAVGTYTQMNNSVGAFIGNSSRGNGILNVRQTSAGRESSVIVNFYDNNAARIFWGGYNSLNPFYDSFTIFSGNGYGLAGTLKVYGYR